MTVFNSYMIQGRGRAPSGVLGIQLIVGAPMHFAHLGECDLVSLLEAIFDVPLNSDGIVVYEGFGEGAIG